jgi:hypothetical protein
VDVQPFLVNTTELRVCEVAGPANDSAFEDYLPNDQRDNGGSN